MFQKPKPKILCFGDSLTAGYLLFQQEDYPYTVKLSELLEKNGYNIEVDFKKKKILFFSFFISMFFCFSIFYFFIYMFFFLFSLFSLFHVFFAFLFLFHYGE